MPGKVMGLCEIYLAKSMEELNKLMKFNDSTFQKSPPHMLARSAMKILTAAETGLNKGDEEMAYINCMKYLHILQHVQKINNHDAIAMFDKQKVQFCLRTAEELSSSLEKRYEILALASAVEETTPPPPLQIAPPRTINGADDPPPEPSFHLQLTSRELFDLIKRYRGSRGLLILDARPAKDFTESHLDEPCVISVPEIIIKAGVSAARLQDQLPPPSLSLWSERQKAEYVVLMDWSSRLSDVKPATKLSILKTILQKWDPKVVYKHDPLILDGGYEDWLNTYPTLTTNSNVKAPLALAGMDVDDLLNNIEYPDFGDSFTPQSVKQQVSIPVINRDLKPSFPEQSIGIPEKQEFSGKSDVPAVHRAAKKAAIERMESERTKLEKSIYETRMRQQEMELLRRNKMVEADKEMQQIKEQSLVEEISRLEALCKQQEEDKRILQQQLDEAKKAEAMEKISTPARPTTSPAIPAKKPPVIVETKPTVATPVIPEKPPAPAGPESVHFEALKIDGPSSGSGLTRSHSSPNINNLVDQQPQFDRATKPVIRNPNTEHVVQRYRDFSPVYGSRGRGLTGLKNLGNSCYMNSIVQCISNTGPLNQYFCDGGYRDDVVTGARTRGQIVEELAAVVRALWTGDFRAIACRDFKRVAGTYHIDFRGTDQQDSHEFLTLLMDWLHDGLNKRRSYKPPPSPANSNPEAEQRPTEELADEAWQEFLQGNDSRIQRLFYGQQSSTVRCQRCLFESVTFEPFTSLTLVLPRDADKCSLAECLAMYLALETVSEWKCPRCKGARPASKKFDIWRLPPILVIHFKRFYQEGCWRKQNTMVDFPITRLDMRSFTARPHQKHIIYELYAVSNHFGTMDGGHYTTYSRSGNGDRWYKFDDADVTEMSEANVRSNAAYILFYTSVNLNNAPRRMYPLS